MGHVYHVFEGQLGAVPAPRLHSASMRTALVPLLTLAALLVAPGHVRAEEPVAACHCFRDRSYDPDKPAAADPYILATTRSSTLAAVYGAEKATLVRIVMGGTPADDLWVAHWAGARLGKDPLSLLERRKTARAWTEVIGASDAKLLGGAFAEQLAGGASREALAAVAVDAVVVDHLNAAPDLVRVTRAAGAGSAELILTLILAPRLGLGPPDLLAAVKDGKSWGALLTEAGIAPADIDEVVKSVVQRARPQPWLLR